MNPGELRHRIQIFQYKEFENEAEEKVQKLVLIGSVWAKVEITKATEKEIEGKNTPSVEHKITIRYRHISENNIIEFNGKKLNINGVIPDERKAYIELVCTEEVKSWQIQDLI